MALSACRYSATYRTPVLIHLDEEVSEGRSVITVEKKKHFPEKCLVSRAEKVLPSGAFSDSGWNTVTGKGSRCILTGGSLWAAVTDILNGYREFRIIKIGTSNPFPEEAALRYLKGVTDVMVMDGEYSRFLSDVYMLKGKYDLKFAVHPFSAYGRELSDISEFIAGMIPLSDRKILVRAKPVAERSVFSLPILPDRRGEEAEAGLECQMSLSAG